MSLQELSDATGIPISTLGNYENIDMSLSNLISVFSVYTKLETVSHNNNRKNWAELRPIHEPLLINYIHTLKSFL